MSFKTLFNFALLLITISEACCMHSLHKLTQVRFPIVYFENYATIKLTYTTKLSVATGSESNEIFKASIMNTDFHQGNLTLSKKIYNSDDTIHEHQFNLIDRNLTWRKFEGQETCENTLDQSIQVRNLYETEVRKALTRGHIRYEGQRWIENELLFFWQFYTAAHANIRFWGDHVDHAMRIKHIEIVHSQFNATMSNIQWHFNEELVNIFEVPEICNDLTV